MTIKTGRKLVSDSVIANGGQELPRQFDDGALLSDKDTTMVSPVFSVTSVPKRIVAYGLFTGTVQIQRILLPNSATSVDACGGINGLPDAREKPFTVGCKPVMLCAGQDEIVIDAVGTYRLVYVGEGRETLHVVAVEEPVTTITNNLRGIEECCYDK